MPFNWTIDEIRDWPPRDRPHPPFGPTLVELLRSCPLRGCFEASKHYERRMSFPGRVGTAFHRTLQSLVDCPAGGTPGEVAEDARRRFAAELEMQEAEMGDRIREQCLPRDRIRASRAAEAILSEALRLHRESGSTPCSGPAPPALSKLPAVSAPEAQPGANTREREGVQVEVPVQSADGLIRGRIDRVEHTASGVRIVDYKSALRDDLPDRYLRQVQLYALLWYETWGQWPIEVEIVYPLTGISHQLPVDPEYCRQIGAESKELIERLTGGTDPYDLATPGDVCKVCEFRPWCLPFWEWQAEEDSQTIALQRGGLGFEGCIEHLNLISNHWQIRIAWRDVRVLLVAPEERFPQLHNAWLGMRVRVLDATLHGLRHEPHARVSETTEVFLMESDAEALTSSGL